MRLFGSESVTAPGRSRRGWALVLGLGLAPAGALAQTSAGSLEVTEQVYTGWKYFQVYCARCHGDNALGSMAAPDLTYSVSEEGGVTADSFAFIVRQGAADTTAPDRRMRGFEDLLDQPLIEALYAYVRARSDSSLPPGRPHRAPAADPAAPADSTSSAGTTPPAAPADSAGSTATTPSAAPAP
jgi:mono/diheme cytochrome c family protein